jgi:hypothetical protein
MTEVVIDKIDDLRAKVFGIEEVMSKMPQVELEHINYFSHRVYARELHIPAGVTLTGKIHKFTNLNFLLKGEMIVKTEDGIVRVVAPYTVVSPPGTKRIAHAVTDCVWTTVHGTDSKDVDAIELQFVAETEQEYLAFASLKEIGV